MSQSVRAEVAALDPKIPTFDVKTLEEHVGISLFLQRMAATLLASSVCSRFRCRCRALRSYGVYGQPAHSELGIRMSVGAKQGDVLKTYLGQGLRLAVIGMVGGLVTALAVTRLSAHLLYGVMLPIL